MRELTPSSGSDASAAEGRAEAESRLPRLVLVTGMSGAGRSLALKALEDTGFIAIDNMPLAFLGSLAARERETSRDVAVGVDVRTRDFGVGSLLDGMDRLRADNAIRTSLLFLDSSDEVLRRRFTESRRPHPLAGDRPVMDGIARERHLLAGLRDRADLMIDTTDLEPAGLRRILAGHFGPGADRRMTIFATSFSYRHGIPRDADLVFDVRFLANPHYESALRPLTGRDEKVGSYIESSEGFPLFFDRLTALFETLIPGFEREGKSYLTIAIGCTGGRHRSVFVCERLAAWLRERGYGVDLSHRDVDIPRS